MTDDAPLDATTAAERTSLAWQRTGLAIIVTGALLVHALAGGGVLRVIPGVVLVATGVVVAAFVGPLRYRAILRKVEADQSPREHALATAASLTVIAAVVAAAIVLVG